jgi:hypothetical protein
MRTDKDVLRAALEQRRIDWQGILRGPYVELARVVLQHLIDLPIVVWNTPPPPYIKKGDTSGHWTATARQDGLAVGLSVASPKGTVSSYQPVFEGIWRSDRPAT